MAKSITNLAEMKDGSIDAGLFLLEIAANEPLSVADIAFVCGCSKQNIEYIERRALRKMKAELIKRNIESY